MLENQFLDKWVKHPLFNLDFNELNLNYAKVSQAIKGLELLNFNPDEYLYILDLNRLNFFYYEKNPYFLSVKKDLHVKNVGYLYFTERVHETQYQQVINILDIFYDYHFLNPQENIIISYDVLVNISEEETHLMTHKLKPLKIDAEKNLWMVLFYSSISKNKCSEKITVYDTISKKETFYNVQTKKIVNSETSVFTTREIEVIQWIIKGNSVKEIATKLFISENTVKYHKKNIFGKSHCKNALELIHYAINKELIKL